MRIIRTAVFITIIIAALNVTGCMGNRYVTAPYRETTLPAAAEETLASEEVQSKPSAEPQALVTADVSATISTTEAAAEIQQADWSNYFHGLNGAAVIFLPDDNKYMIYNEELGNIRRSPCSTFKIISSLTGIEEGVIKDADTVRKWSGEKFWNEKWNRDIGFQDAFQSSCIWYFREVIDELGPDKIQEQLDLLNYGNCDITDWQGHLNNNNSNPALTGFWVESSLKISAKEQTEVMERIFGENSVYRPDTLNLMKNAMLVTDADTGDINIYGKTGMGKSHGITVDAWYTGFAETTDGKAYFCIYIGQTDGIEVSSAEAKRIAIQCLNDVIPMI